MVVGFGTGDEIIRVLSGTIGIRFGPGDSWLIYAYSVPASVFIIVGACNATNLIDGLDGLCSGVIGIISVGFLALAVHMHLHSAWGPRDVQRVVLALALFGSAVGFLPFNRNPARIFMGDAGSMLLGLNAAILLLMFADEQLVNWMIGSVMVMGLPLADMVLTLVRRWRAQKPLMAGDRSHFYDQLIDQGFTVRQVVRISYALAAIFVLMGMVPIFVRMRHVVLIYGAFFVLLAYVVHRFGMVRVDSPRRVEG
ncbi:MAG: undecaprenyl/decaprenyl-phosphate alpha-N-acetylglucosaminyl 1-phosphate transferase [Planctomycetes bacterium]|nr:undecaprenyl/decaprenyl-phosphate alpha-N-acetylglucosaminyl 1-phosphate transferase [Planctomycetota bacterium]